ncbi:MAG TPA: hypothetical protein VMT19_12660 [Thermoanaerobaculaceae bacterium]|nr:hypothetical protein [Thermoanaerobaculaceae bacterium]
MILQSALVVLAASAFQAPAPEPAKTSVLPLDCGLTEEQVLRALIPDYEAKVTRFRNADLDDRLDYRFEPKINTVVETSFGWPDKHLMVMTVNSSVGQCEDCHEQVVGVIDLPSKKVLWWEERAGTPLGSPIRLLLDGDGGPAFSVQEYHSSTSWGEETSEVLFGPRFGPDGALRCDLLWESLIDFEVQGNQPGGGYEGCGQLRGPDKTGTFMYERRIFLGKPTDDVVEPDGGGGPPPGKAVSREHDVPCMAAGEVASGAVEIRRTETWRPAGGSHKLVLDRVAVQRIDHSETKDFPLNLPVRTQRLLLGPRRVAVSRGADGERSVNSPDTRLRAFADPETSPLAQSLRIADSKGKIRRTIPLVGTFAKTVYAVGWSADSQRLFAVVGFARDEAALLSFSVKSTNDYWEDLLAGTQKVWTDGFVLEPHLASRKPARKATDR